MCNAHGVITTKQHCLYTHDQCVCLLCVSRCSSAGTTLLFCHVHVKLFASCMESFFH